MGKLKAWYYLKNNKKRAAILIVSFGLYYALLYGVRFFMNPMYYTDEAVYLGNVNLVQSAYINQADLLPMDDSLWEENSEASDEDKIIELNRATGEFAKKLEKDNRIDYVLQCFTYGISINSLTGSTQYNVPMVTKDEAKLLCDYVGVKLVEGTYPLAPGDIVMDENMAKNCHIRIGDTLYDNSTRVCGIVSSRNYFAVGLAFEELLVKRVLFFLDQGTVTDLKQFFEEIGWEASEKNTSQIQILNDAVSSKQEVEGFKKELDQPLNVMVYTITFVMGVTLYFVYKLHVKDRYEEWCLYRSLGYSQREVFSLSLREYGICIVGSGVLAFVFLLIIFWVGGNVMENRGIVYRLWLPETFRQLTATVIFMTGVLQIPVFHAMQHTTTIDAIEDDI